MGGAEPWLLLGLAMLATGVVSGVLAGLFGIGGGIVIVPVLDTALALFDTDPAVRLHVAVATSLAVIVPTSIASARAHLRRDSVDLAVVRRWAPFVLAGSLGGAWIASQVDTTVLAIVFAVTTLFVATKSLFRFGENALTDGIPGSPLLGLVPAAIGTVSTLMGIGGGVLSVMVLRLFNQPMRRAIGTAALLGLVISVPGALGMVAAGWDDPRLPVASLGFVNVVGVLAIAPVSVACAPVGAHIAHKLDERLLSAGFALLLFGVSARLFYRAFG